jgi:pimeloyl-ACP methyl ester carboxylesterase
LKLSLIAVHGNGGGGFRFSPSAPYYPESINFSAPTLPGFADVPRDPELTSLADYAEVLREHVRKQPAPRVLLGTGIGGAIALEYIQHPADDLAGVILHAPVGTRLDTRTFPKLMRTPGMSRLGQWAFSSRLTRPLFRRLLFSEPLPDDVVDRFFDEYARCSVFSQMFRIIDADWFASLEPRHLPAALLWGEREKLLTVDQLEDYKALLPNHRVEVIPEWDHFPMLETPEAFARVTTELALDLISNRNARIA